MLTTPSRVACTVTGVRLHGIDSQRAASRHAQVHRLGCRQGRRTHSKHAQRRPVVTRVGGGSPRLLLALVGRDGDGGHVAGQQSGATGRIQLAVAVVALPVHQDGLRQACGGSSGMAVTTLYAIAQQFRMRVRVQSSRRKVSVRLPVMFAAVPGRASDLTHSLTAGVSVDMCRHTSVG